MGRTRCDPSWDPVEKAEPVFGTVNATPMPVSFGQLVDRDQMTGACEPIPHVILDGLDADGSTRKLGIISACTHSWQDRN